jgi:hypothetical protein
LGNAICLQVYHHSLEKAPEKPLAVKENPTVKIPADLVEK